MFAEVFAKELKGIKNKQFRDAVITLGEGTPEYLYKIPSSSTGKYHPADEISPGGQIIHIRRVFQCAEESGRLAKLSVEDQDILYAGALLHDMFKNGLPKTRYTVKNHPVLVYRHIMTTMVATDSDVALKLRKLAYICLLHEGQWTIPQSYEIANDDFEVEEMAEFTSLADAMHAADYWASRRTVYDMMQKGAVEGVKKEVAA